MLLPHPGCIWSSGSNYHLPASVPSALALQYADNLSSSLSVPMHYIYITKICDVINLLTSCKQDKLKSKHQCQVINNAPPHVKLRSMSMFQESHESHGAFCHSHLCREGRIHADIWTWSECITDQYYHCELNSVPAQFTTIRNDQYLSALPMMSTLHEQMLKKIPFSLRLILF